jgi:hypothetical protein
VQTALLVVLVVLVRLSPQQGWSSAPHARHIPLMQVVPRAPQYVAVVPNVQQAWFTPPQDVQDVPL